LTPVTSTTGQFMVGRGLAFLAKYSGKEKGLGDFSRSP
jgi:hypothetical protein